MIHIGAAVGPLKGARQRRGSIALVKSFAWDDFVIQIFGQRRQPRRDLGPVVERRLQRRRDRGRVGIPGKIVRNDDQAAVAAGFRSEEHTSELQSLLRLSYAL